MKQNSFIYGSLSFKAYFSFLKHESEVMMGKFATSWEIIVIVTVVVVMEIRLRREM